MPNSSKLHQLMAVSPHFELILRRIYWKNVKYLKRHMAGRRRRSTRVHSIDMELITSYLVKIGVRKDSLLLLHSSLDALKGSNLSPNAILDGILDLVTEGTLAMPAFPGYPNTPNHESYLSDDHADRLFVYNLQTSKVRTGALPYLLTRRPNSIRSRHPINSMVAAGRLATWLMESNLDGESPLPCGSNSSWKRCVDENAWVVGLGIDLTHSLTIIHVAEEVLDAKWPISNWYRSRRFQVIDEEFKQDYVLRERRPMWGALHFGERRLCKDLIDHGIMISSLVDGVIVEAVRAGELFDFLNSKNSAGYPYYHCS